MKKKTILKTAGFLGAVAAAGAIAYKTHQIDEKMKGYAKRYKFAGKEIKFTEEFDSDSIAVNFAGLELDFTEATLKDGKGTLELFAEFSGVEVIVPEEWAVVATGINNKSGVSNAFAKDEIVEMKPTLTIHYDVNFSGLDIRKPGEDEEEACCDET